MAAYEQSCVDYVCEREKEKESSCQSKHEKPLLIPLFLFLIIEAKKRATGKGQKDEDRRERESEGVFQVLSNVNMDSAITKATFNYQLLVSIFILEKGKTFVTSDAFFSLFNE